jgi:leucyl-tRNA synthetase
MEYNFTDIEKRWKKYWNENHVYKVSNDSNKPKCYVLDMFPYPSGAGLHVGHPLGYIASDIYARYKRLKGFNVLHPMGYDAFGLPAEQYAIETGQHPADTTEKNIARYREQLDNIGFCYDWSREVRTADPKYYKWTQWIFLQLFHSWYNRREQKAQPLTTLTAIFEKEGNANHPAPGDSGLQFDAATWNAYDDKTKRDVLMHYRLAYQGYAQVWWCEALGTVLANDEVVNGVSERGGHPVERKNMRQWFLRITEYADRLLTSLDTLDWTEAMKEMQRNWIGKSSGAEVRFNLSPSLSEGEGGALRETVTEAKNTTPNWNTASPFLYDSIKDFRKELKNNLTEAEAVLWKYLKANNLGVKFRRQHIIGQFIPDFVCLNNKLIVEVDGKIHLQQQEQDAARTEALNSMGYTVLRFDNEEILADVDAVVEKIKVALDSMQKSGPRNTSLSEGEGRGEVSVFTTRPDTIFGVDFMVLAPEHDLVDAITTPEQRNAINQYREYVKSRSERERMTEVKQVTGCFTGAYAEHPLTGRQIPIWISEYVLIGYGTGAIMAVPSGDDRDHAFAKHFSIPITNIFGDKYTGEAAYSDKTGILHNSDFVTGMSVTDAAEAIIATLEKMGAGTRRVNYRLRDAGFSRQRYWGEPFPIVYINDQPYGTDEFTDEAISQLPVELPHVKTYSPGPEGQGPLANVTDWVNIQNTSLPSGEGWGGATRETNTMPGYAGSSWYFLRYMDPHNDTEFASRKATDYWQQVDLYIGGTEHAVGHLLYSRMWTKALCDLGHIGFDEPFKKLVNQGMIQGQSYFVNDCYWTKDFVEGDTQQVIVPFLKSYVPNNKFSIAREVKPYEYNGKMGYISWGNSAPRLRYGHLFVDTKDRLTKSQYFKYLVFHNHDKDNAERELSRVLWEDNLTEDGEQYIQCKMEVEKMSKSKYNVVNPDDIVAQYGADTFRMYEMFLGPIDVSKPWDTKGIEGVHRFLKKLWRLYADEQNGWVVNDEAPTEAELRTLHKTIKKVNEDIERFSFNTSVSQFMICVNELAGCHKRAVLEPLVIILAPFAPHIAEELWQNALGKTGTVLDAAFPQHQDSLIAESSITYAVSVNGKKRAELAFAADAAQADVEKEVLADATVIRWLEGKEPKKIIFVKGKMVNVVV